MAAFVSFRDLKQRVSIEDVLRHYGLWDTLSPRGADGLSGPCPLHQGTSSDHFRVSPAKNCWKCFGCGKGGNILDFVAQKENTELRPAALLIQSWIGEKKPAPAGETPATRPGTVGAGEHPTSDNASTEPKQAEPREPTAPVQAVPACNPVLPFAELKNLDPRHPFLQEKGFRAATMERFGVGYCAKGLHAGRIAIPIHNEEGGLVAYAGCSTEDGASAYPERFRKELELFNLHRVLADPDSEEGVILVADFFDVFRLHEAGCGNAAALMGEGISEEQVRLLCRTLGERAEITLFLPRGAAGTLGIVGRLLPHFFVRIVWPEGESMRPQDLPVGELWEMFKF
jgi:DNA primase